MSGTAKSSGPILVILAALLWASDSIFRVPTASRYDPTWIVFIEHLIGFGIMSILVLPMVFKEIKGLSKLDWFASAIIGIGASALATLFFTASYRYVNPSVALLLQKFQPVCVSLLAIVFLHERPPLKFWIWAPIALIAGTMVVLPEIDLRLISTGLDFRSKGVLYAVTATLLWSFSTIIAKKMLGHVSFMALTYLRYGFGLITLMVLVPLSGLSFHFDVLSTQGSATPFIYMALFPGLLAMVAYYSGLSRTPASVATYLELLYPVGGAVLNFLVMGISLTTLQLFGSAVLIAAIIQISKE